EVADERHPKIPDVIVEELVPVRGAIPLVRHADLPKVGKALCNTCRLAGLAQGGQQQRDQQRDDRDDDQQLDERKRAPRSHGKPPNRRARPRTRTAPGGFLKRPERRWPARTRCRPQWSMRPKVARGTGSPAPDPLAPPGEPRIQEVEDV